MTKQNNHHDLHQRRSAQNMKILTYEQIQQKILTVPKMRDRALCAILYLTAGRITEIVGDKKTDKEPVLIGSVTKEEINKRTFLIIKQVRTIKRKKNPRTGQYPKVYRNLPICVDKTRLLCQALVDWTWGKPLNEPIFPGLERKYAHQLVKDSTGLFPHYFRHARLSHLAAEGLSDAELIQFTGWVNRNMANTYAHLAYTDLAFKMSL